MIAIFKNKLQQPAAAQTALYNRHYRRLYNTCLRIIGNAMEAEEAMHDSFLKIFDNLGKVPDEQAFYAWSQSITIRTAIDRIRKKKIYFEPVENLVLAEEAPIDEETLPLNVETIKKKLAALPDGYRIILSMRLLEECAFSTIAETLNIKESTVRSQFVRGKEKLKQSMEESLKELVEKE
jgi:RNA polymerase sigma-70 factor (ECF subfamily)